MSRIDHYIKRVMQHIHATPERRMQFEEDLRAHYEELIKQGESEESAFRRMGRPEDIAAEYMSGLGFRYASFWHRLFAWFLDHLLLSLVIMPFVFILFFLPNLIFGGSLIMDIIREDMISMIDYSPFQIISVIFSMISIMGIHILYFPVLETIYGRTPGKMALGLRVLTDNGAPIKFGAALVRRIPMYASIEFIDAVFILFTEKKQRAFDMVAKTIVVIE